MRQAFSNHLATLALTFALISLTGCSCEKKPKAEDLTKPPQPLVAVSVPSRVKAEVHVQVGATGPRPVVLVMAEDPATCKMARERLGKKSHILCSSAPPGQAEKELKAAVGFLQETYPRHLSPSPVLLLSDAARSRAAWFMMLSESGVFAHAFIPGLEEKVLTSTTLRALSSRGARTLVVALDETNRLKLLIKVASRKGLSVHALGAKGAHLDKAITLLTAADERFNPPKPADKPKNPAKTP